MGGCNSSGECAVDVNMKRNILLPRKIECDGLKDVGIQEIKAGSYHSGCVTMNGDYYLWGGNKFKECCIEDEDIIKVSKPNVFVKKLSSRSLFK